MTTDHKKAQAAVEAAKQALEGAIEAHKKAEAATEKHAELLAKAESDLATLEASVSGSLGSPESAALWREQRTKLASEIDGLRVQAGAMAAAVHPAKGLIEQRRVELRAAEQRAYRAELRELLANPKLAEAAETFARAWVMHVHGDNPYLPVGSGEAMGAWLFADGGVYPLRKLFEHVQLS